MPKIEGNITRCDLRVPNELYERIEALANERGAKIHHRSGKTEVTGTILELIQIGLTYRHLSDNQTDKLSGIFVSRSPHELSDGYLEDLAGLVQKKLSVNLSDNQPDILSGFSDSNLEELIARVGGMLAERVSNILLSTPHELSDEYLELIATRVHQKLSVNLSDILSGREEIEAVVDRASDKLSDKVSDIERVLTRYITREELERELESLKAHLFGNNPGVYGTDLTDGEEETDISEEAPEPISAASLATIFDEDEVVEEEVEEVVEKEIEEVVEQEAPTPYRYKNKNIKRERPPFPADGLGNSGVGFRYGIYESTFRNWAKTGKHLILIVGAGETIRYYSEHRKWFLLDPAE